MRSAFVLKKKRIQKKVQSPVSDHGVIILNFGIIIPWSDIVSFIQHELQGSRFFIGYCAMQQGCIKN